jgi:membrane protein implicated in regulation of membrane protease activity
MFKAFIPGNGIVDEVMTDKEGNRKYRVRFQSSIWNAVLHYSQTHTPLEVGDTVWVEGYAGITLIIKHITKD